MNPSICLPEAHNKPMQKGCFVTHDGAEGSLPHGFRSGQQARLQGQSNHHSALDDMKQLMLVTVSAFAKDRMPD